ncbi:unnamed protein product, partial [Hapterophycus canaliculatus]
SASSKENGVAVDESDGDDGDEEEEEEEITADVEDDAATGSRKKADAAASAPDPLRWVFNRMSHMVVHKGEARRRAVFSWFLAMVAVHEPAVSASHLKLMLLPLRRAVLDAERSIPANTSINDKKNAPYSNLLRIFPRRFPPFPSALNAQQVMELLEGKVGSGLFLEALTSVNMDISRKRVERKRQRAVEKATDPVAAAERRRERTE